MRTPTAINPVNAPARASAGIHASLARKTTPEVASYSPEQSPKTATSTHRTTLWRTNTPSAGLSQAHGRLKTRVAIG